MRRENFAKNGTLKNPKSTEETKKFGQFRSTILHHKSDLNLSESSDEDDSDKKVEISKPEMTHHKPEVEKKKIHFQQKVLEESSSEDDGEMASKLVDLVKKLKLKLKYCVLKCILKLFKT